VGLVPFYGIAEATPANKAAQVESTSEPAKKP